MSRIVIMMNSLLRSERCYDISAPLELLAIVAIKRTYLLTDVHCLVEWWDGEEEEWPAANTWEGWEKM